jgi:hypothetical protein
MDVPLFSQISKIVPNKPETFSAKFLTIDIDWATDEVINDTINIVEAANVEATWFVTHSSDALSRLRENQKFELGIHPNFNSLLDGSKKNGGDIRVVIEKLLEIVPDAKSLRSHSLLTSTRLLQLMPQYGLTHEANIYMPSASCNDIRPFSIWNGLVRVPHSFEDDLYLLSRSNCDSTNAVSISTHVSESFMSDHKFQVFDFHPIHIFLNSENLDRYESTREIHRIPEQLIKNRFTGDGTRSAFKKILGLSE